MKRKEPTTAAIRAWLKARAKLNAAEVDALRMGSKGERMQSLKTMHAVTAEQRKKEKKK